MGSLSAGDGVAIVGVGELVHFGELLAVEQRAKTVVEVDRVAVIGEFTDSA